MQSGAVLSGVMHYSARWGGRAVQCVEVRCRKVLGSQGLQHRPHALRPLDHRRAPAHPVPQHDAQDVHHPVLAVSKPPLQLPIQARLHGLQHHPGQRQTAAAESSLGTPNVLLPIFQLLRPCRQAAAVQEAHYIREAEGPLVNYAARWFRRVRS